MIDADRMRRAANLADEMGQLVGVESDELRLLVDAFEALQQIASGSWAVGLPRYVDNPSLFARDVLVCVAGGGAASSGWPLRPDAAR